MTEPLVSTALRRAAEHVVEFGWARKQLFDLTHRGLSQEALDTAPSCAVGAIGWATGKYVVDTFGNVRIATSQDRPLTAELSEQSCRVVNGYLRDVRGYQDDVVAWNDNVAENRTDVVELLLEVAKWYTSTRGLSDV